ncbi:hypothetical protein [Brevibacillus laterosporus]|uniref:hypothetical protein n=1 Tax=Brevibacillus laterosporus TaxID=1465 RepID=UPI000E6CF460|nr:hypothetical protein [Brevibacillus laterosporus]AYB37614.1 hypothetical protein D5F52_04575 [Brevibacillus laterosporus]MBM7110857.1 hypothetical protein [Brevibacillus laterosporus]
MKAELVNNLEDLKAVRQLVNELQIKDSSKKIIKSAINDAFKTVNKKLYIIESREKTKLETKMIDNHKVTIPKGLYSNKNAVYYYGNGVIYQISKPRFDQDKSFHMINCVWIDEVNRQTKLIVRTLGGDNYGDRYFLEAGYFKDIRDEYPYLTKAIRRSNYKYKEYVEKVLAYIREFNGFENFHVKGKTR